MRRKDRILMAFRGEVPDRVGTFEQAFASSVASAILGRPALTGSTSLHYEESRAWMRGEAAHAEFLAQVAEDTVAIVKRMDFDAIYSPWRMGARPSRQVDERTFLYGDDGHWVKMSFDPASQTFGESGRARPMTLEDAADSMKKTIESAARAPAPSLEDLDPMARRFVREFGHEYAVATGGAGLSIPINAPWMEATILERALVEDYLDARTEAALRLLPVLKRAGFDYVNGGGDFADKNGPIYSPRFYDEVMSPRWKRIMAKCRELDLPYVMRSDGNLWPVAGELFGRIRPHAYGEVDWEAGMDAAKLRAAFPELTLFGNVPCGSLMLKGAPEQVAEAARYVVRAAAPRLVLGTSNSILHGTPPENVFALFETGRSFSEAFYRECRRV